MSIILPSDVYSKLALAMLIFATGCKADSTFYTLYRSSVLDADMRLHVATFDAKEDEGYNMENCQIAAELFARQPGVTVRYWCEKGRFRE